MRVSKKVKDLIMYDNQFSLELSKMLDIQQLSLKQLVKRDSDRLTLFQCVEFYKSKGFTEDEIFEKEPA